VPAVVRSNEPSYPPSGSPTLLLGLEKGDTYSSARRDNVARDSGQLIVDVTATGITSNVRARGGASVRVVRHGCAAPTESAPSPMIDAVLGLADVDDARADAECRISRA